MQIVHWMQQIQSLCMDYCRLDFLLHSSQVCLIYSTSKIDEHDSAMIKSSSSLFLHRQIQLNSVNNMSWRIKPEEVLIEVGKLFGSKVGLQKLNYEVRQIV